MTRTLDAAIAGWRRFHQRNRTVSVVRRAANELADDEQWTRKFEASQESLNGLAAEARADRAAGRTTDVDPDSL